MNKDIVFPDYNNCVLNLINSILKHYNVNTDYNGLTLLNPILNKNFKNIVLIILDGMGNNLLHEVSPNNFFENNKLGKITSVCPSTTTAALNTYYSGRPPIETGYIAWSQYFKEYGRALDMFPRTDSYTGTLYDHSSSDVFEMLDYKNIFQQIEDSNPKIRTYEINPTYCESRAKRCIKANSIDVMCDDIESLCKNMNNNFIFAYSDYPDKLLHRYGCSSTEVAEFILNAEASIESLAKHLYGTNTLLIISADHGHNDIYTSYNIMELTEINECLIMPPSFESRAITFWVKEDRKDKFEKIFRQKFKDEFILFTKEEFLSKKLLGNGVQHKKIDDFIGNYIAISISNSIIKLQTALSSEKYEKLSTHCGFTENEMIIPLIVKEIL